MKIKHRRIHLSSLERWGPEGWTPKGGPQKFRFFFPPPPFRSFYVSLGVFSLNFGGVFEGQRALKCARSEFSVVV